MYYLIAYLLIGFGTAGYALALNKREMRTFYLSDIARLLFVITLWPMVAIAYIPWEKLSKFDRKLW
jgi:hypothetical protein